MNIYFGIIVMGSALAFCCGDTAFAADSKHPAKPNILLVMADDQGYGDCGFTGHPFVRTPNLDEMSRHGIVFNRFYAAAPVCSPTRASVLTGRHPFRGNVPNHGHYLRPDEMTIAEALKSAGYHHRPLRQVAHRIGPARQPHQPRRRGF